MQIQLHSLCRAKTCICGLKIEPFTNIQLGTQIHIQQNIKVLKNLFHFSIFNTFRQFKDKSTWGAWIAEWYYTWFLLSLRCAMPWALSSSLGNNKLFWTQAQHLLFIHDSTWFIWFDTIVCLSNLSCELWNSKLKIKEFF